MAMVLSMMTIRQKLGDPHPDVTMGITLGASYKGFDLSVTGFGAFGQQVARSFRKFTDGEFENFTTEVYDYWHGEGTSNKYPSARPHECRSKLADHF